MLRQLLAVLVAVLAMLLGVCSSAELDSTPASDIAGTDGAPAEAAPDCESEALLDAPDPECDTPATSRSFATGVPRAPGRVYLDQEAPPPRPCA